MAARNNTTIHVESAGPGQESRGGPGFVIFNGFLDCDGNMCRVPPGRGGSDFCHGPWLHGLIAGELHNMDIFTDNFQ